MPFGGNDWLALTAAQSHPVEVCLVPDLLWGEVDYNRHYERLINDVVPALRGR